MKKRLIPRQYIEKAYTKDSNIKDMDLNLEDINPSKLPDEMFEILGEVISFIEIINKNEGENNENK